MPDAKKILIIEDSALNRKILEDALVQKGYQTLTAEDGREGMDKLNKDSPDLVIMDVVMPNMNGWETCKQIRAAAKVQATPIIIMTSKNTPQDMLQAFEVGADEFLDKPINLEEMYETVERLLNRGAQQEKPA